MYKTNETQEKNVHVLSEIRNRNRNAATKRLYAYTLDLTATRIDATLDAPPQIAVNEEWRCVGG